MSAEMFVDRESESPEQSGNKETPLPGRPKRGALTAIFLSLSGCVLPGSEKSGELAGPLALDEGPPPAVAVIDDQEAETGTAQIAPDSAGAPTTALSGVVFRFPVAEDLGAPQDPAPAPTPTQETATGVEQPAAHQPATSTSPGTPNAGTQVGTGDSAKSVFDRAIDLLPEWLRRAVMASGPWILAGLAITAAIGGIRGTVKAISHFYLKWQARRHFERREWLDTATLNVHSLHEKDETLQLKVKTAAVIPLANFFSNSYLVDRFMDAARDCTPEQPFPVLNYDEERQGSRFRRLFQIPRPFQRATPQQQEDRLLAHEREGLNRTNKFFRELISMQSAKGIWEEAFGLPTREESFVVITLCAIRHGERGKSLVVAALPERDFHRFGSEEDISKMITADEKLLTRIQNLQRAYRYDKRYQENHGSNQPLFPRVMMTISAPAAPLKVEPAEQPAFSRVVNQGGQDVAG